MTGIFVLVMESERRKEERDYDSLVQISVVPKDNHLTLTIQYASYPCISIELASNMDEWLRTSRLSFKKKKGIGEEGEREQIYDVNIIENSPDKHVIYYRVKRNLAVATTDYLDAMGTRYQSGRRLSQSWIFLGSNGRR